MIGSRFPVFWFVHVYIICKHHIQVSTSISPYPGSEKKKNIIYSGYTIYTLYQMLTAADYLSRHDLRHSAYQQTKHGCGNKKNLTSGAKKLSFSNKRIKYYWKTLGSIGIVTS